MSCRLFIKICEAKKVLKMDHNAKSDPYVTFRLKSQDKKDVKKTQVICNTLNPVWNQEYDLIVTDPNDVLLINMYNEGIKNDDKMMDELQFPVKTWQIGGKLDHKEIDVKLKKKKAGKFIFEVQSFPIESPKNSQTNHDEKQGCRIHIKAFKSKNILKMDVGGASDPFLRFHLKNNEKSKVETAIIDETLNPIWNEDFDIISNDRNTDVLLVDMFDSDITYNAKMMDTIEIPLKYHPLYTHYIFDTNINLKKKNAGSLHFELDFLPIKSESSENLERSKSSENSDRSEKSENIDNDQSEEKNDDSQNKIKVKGNKIKLLTNSIKQVPLDNYEKNFTFVINNKKFKTSRIISDLISPKISKLHRNDPTASEFYINTKAHGNFQTILDLVTFKSKEIKNEEIEFILEIFDQLGIENSTIERKNFEFTVDKAIEIIENHGNTQSFYLSNLQLEIEYLSEHFYELNETQKNQISQFPMSTIEKIICNDHLHLESEDQLLKFINKLYEENNDFSNLYEYVCFSNVESDAIDEFLQIFNFNDLTTGTWYSISKRLNNLEKNIEREDHNSRYRRKIPFSNSNMNGIFSFLQKKSNIDDEINVTASSHGSGNWHQLVQNDNNDDNYYTNYESNPWICFEFKKYKIIPTNYTIRSNDSFFINWVIEGSEDNKTWTTIDEQRNFKFTNKNSYSFSVKTKYEKEFKFIRIRNNSSSLHKYINNINISFIEFYGFLI